MEKEGELRKGKGDLKDVFKTQREEMGGEGGETRGREPPIEGRNDSVLSFLLI